MKQIVKILMIGLLIQLQFACDDDENIKSKIGTFTLETSEFSVVEYEELSFPAPNITPQNVEVVYSITKVLKEDVNNTDALEYFEVDSDGVITLAKGHMLEKGSYKVILTATNIHFETDVATVIYKLSVTEAPKFSVTYPAAVNISKSDEYLIEAPVYEPELSGCTHQLIEVKKGDEVLDTPTDYVQLSDDGSMVVNSGQNYEAGSYTIVIETTHPDYEYQVVRNELVINVLNVEKADFAYTRDPRYYDKGEDASSGSPFIISGNWTFSIEGITSVMMIDLPVDKLISIDESGIVTVSKDYMAKHGLDNSSFMIVNVKAKDGDKELTADVHFIAEKTGLQEVNYTEVDVMTGGTPLVEGETLVLSKINMVPNNLPNTRFSIREFYLLGTTIIEDVVIDPAEYGVVIDEETGVLTIPTNKLPKTHTFSNGQVDNVRFTLTIRVTFENSYNMPAYDVGFVLKWEEND